MEVNMVPQSLRNWFIAHFWIDIAFALPLFIAPDFCLRLLGWQQVDPISTRLAAAALFGIGIESYLGRNADRSSFIAMLNLKCIWAGSATVGIFWSMLQGSPPMGWGFCAIFAAFFCIWFSFRRRLMGATSAR